MRILTYNIHKGIGGRDRRYRIERVVELIAGQAADLVCLQEVDRGVRRSRFDDQPRLLAERLSARAALFQLNVRLKHGGYGNLLLSRWPLIEKHQVSLRLEGKKPRGAQLAVVDSPEGAVHIVNWHLGLAERERHWQVERLLAHPLFRRQHGMPTLLAGDTNDWRNSLASAALADAGFATTTRRISRYRTFPAWMPIGALDKVFHSTTRVAIERVRVVRSRLAKQASDHLPLVVDFSLRSV